MKASIPGSDAIFRVLFSIIFIGAGMRHLLRPEAIVARYRFADSFNRIHHTFTTSQETEQTHA